MEHTLPEPGPRLSLIIPCYDEERRLPATLARVQEYLEAAPYPYEILVVDDGSRDGTAAVAEAAGAMNPRVRLLAYDGNRGKGFAVKYGALRAAGEWVLFSDADLSTPIEELEKFLPRLEAGADVVIGSRALAQSRLEVRQPWWRERAGRCMNFLIRRLSGLSFPDTQCGFKLFSRRAAQDIFPSLLAEGWMFDVEALIIARKLGYRIEDVPVTWINSADSRVRPSQIFRILRELFLIRARWFRRQPQRHAVEEGGVATQPSP
jgi:dolichyl-phosphate beta-glucosyltransferase